MTEPRVEQIRNFRLRSHHLDLTGPETTITSLVGACGMQNTPPGAWENALHSRVPDCSLEEMGRLLYKERSLLQAWSFRGAPVVFPVSKSDVFLSALVPKGDEPWIYTQGIALALDFLQMDFDELLDMLKQVIPLLDGRLIVSKTALDQTLAQWMLPLLPPPKQGLWNQPSMYGSPDKQTVGGAAVSFLLRPCAFCGLVVFGERSGGSPTFTSYKSWTGRSLKTDETAPQKLARDYLHCYGPATLDSFVGWLGCSKKHGRRIWDTVSEELEPVKVLGKKAFLLSDDRESLLSSASFGRDYILLGGHDPYLDQRDRMILQPDKALHRQIWRLVSNPGAVLYRGEIIGVWTSRKREAGLEIEMTLWAEWCDRQKLLDLAEEYASFRQQKLVSVRM